MQSMMKILIIEDEAALSRSVEAYLRAENYHCEIAPDCQTAYLLLANQAFDCILLDISLPDGNGLQVLKSLKQQGKTEGVIIISARDAIEDRIQGLQLGADDYLTKPFHLSELSARIAAVLRRRNHGGGMIWHIADLSIDTQARTVQVGNQSVDMTPKEYELLMFLASNKNRVVSKLAIAEHLSGDQQGLFDNFDFVYAHMKNLKKKVIQAGWTDHIKAVYGLGYKLEA
jgi:DNA-binding response OmpR family regulator